MKSLPYRFPQLYELGIKLLLKNTLSLRYTKIAQEIGKKNRVLDLGCGTALLYQYLHECHYTGWDLNNSFVKYCQKKGLNVYKKDIFNFSDYPECDYIVLCDVIHHVVPRDELLLREAAKRAHVIVVEPCYERRLPRTLVFLYDQIVGDADGINSFETRMLWDPDKPRLRKKFLTLGAAKVELLDNYMMAVFRK
jgi:SAM-dependent methyltransferase